MPWIVGLLEGRANNPPEGLVENSPAIYRWEQDVPPLLLLLAAFAREQEEEGDERIGPTVETVGYSRASLRDDRIAECKRQLHTAEQLQIFGCHGQATACPCLPATKHGQIPARRDPCHPRRNPQDYVR